MHTSLSTVRFKYIPLGWKHCGSKDDADEFSGEQEPDAQELNKWQSLMEKKKEKTKENIFLQQLET